MPALSLEQVRHVAQLARLELSAEEEQRFAAQLSKILDAAAQLDELDVSAVEPTSHATLLPLPLGEGRGEGPWESPLREDEARPSLGAEKALANAPAKVGTRFAVPKIIE